MIKSKKNAKELHYEHRKWLSDLAELKIELIALAKHDHHDFKKDIGSLLRIIFGLKTAIHKHEKTIVMAYKACGIDDYSEIFPDHENIRKKIDSLKFKIENLKFLFLKYNKYRVAQ